MNKVSKEVKYANKIYIALAVINTWMRARA